jgi:hypothetical protein
LGLGRGINPPGISVTIAQLLDALDQVKPGAASLVHHVPDAAIEAIVGTWPSLFTPVRALALGFARHESEVALIRAFIEDDLEATRIDRGIAI